ncbi:MAG: ABC transporter permease [bacterium]|nr:ABC transporter permease [bacterium]
MYQVQGHLWHLTWVLARADFKLRYHGSVLGFFWALLKPLFIFLVLNLVFSHLFSSGVEYYSLQLLTGIMLWNFFAEGSMLGLTSFVGKAHILTKMSFPRWVVVVASCLQSLMSFAVNFFILVGALLLFGPTLALWQLLMLLAYSLLIFAVILAFSLLTSALFARYRDLNQIWEVLLTGGFFAAPVIYPMTILPESLRNWFYLNPMTFIIEHAKGVIFLAELSRPDHHLIYLGVVLVALLLGIWVFARFQGRAVEYL